MSILNNAAHVAKRVALEEAYMQKTFGRLLSLNCRHKSVKNDIQHTQTYAIPNINGVVLSSWPGNISKSLAIVMMHKQTAKQKKSGGDGGPSKKNIPSQNRGGGSNDTTNVSLTNT